MLVGNPLDTRLNLNRFFLGVASQSPDSDPTHDRDDPLGCRTRSLRSSTPAAQTRLVRLFNL